MNGASLQHKSCLYHLYGLVQEAIILVHEFSSSDKARVRECKADADSLTCVTYHCAWF